MMHHVGVVALGHRAAAILKMLHRVSRIELVAHSDIDEWNCRCLVYRLGESGTLFELVTPLGPGKLSDWCSDNADRSPIHHIAVQVDDVDRVSAELKAAGLRLVSDRGVLGVAGWRVNFVHPSECGLMLELVQVPR